MSCGGCGVDRIVHPEADLGGDSRHGVVVGDDRQVVQAAAESRSQVDRVEATAVRDDRLGLLKHRVVQGNDVEVVQDLIAVGHGQSLPSQHPGELVRSTRAERMRSPSEPVVASNQSAASGEWPKMILTATELSRLYAVTKPRCRR